MCTAYTQGGHGHWHSWPGRTDHPEHAVRCEPRGAALRVFVWRRRANEDVSVCRWGYGKGLHGSSNTSTRVLEYLGTGWCMHMTRGDDLAPHRCDHITIIHRACHVTIHTRIKCHCPCSHRCPAQGSVRTWAGDAESDLDQHGDDGKRANLRVACHVQRGRRANEGELARPCQGTQRHPPSTDRSAFETDRSALVLLFGVTGESWDTPPCIVNLVAIAVARAASTTSAPTLWPMPWTFHHAVSDMPNCGKTKR